MRAYKFLRDGRIAPFSGYAWPVGDWVEAEGAELCVRGIHACRRAHVPYWIGPELWRIELDGDVHEEPRKLVAMRGRLLEPVEGWDAAATGFAEACARRTRERADAATGERAEAVGAYAADAEANAARGEAAVVGYIAARAAEVDAGVAGYADERTAQAEWFAAVLGLTDSQ